MATVYHNTDDAKKIVDFDFALLGENSFFHAADYLYAFSSLIGAWFSSEKFEDCAYHHQYNINDGDYMVMEDNEELISFIYDWLRSRGITEDDFAELSDDIDRSKKLAGQFRDDLLADTYTGIFLKKDLEFGGSSWVCFDPSTIE